MTLVVDASALIAAFVDSQREGEWADSLIASDELAGPELALAEATNILRRMELSGDLSRDKAAAGRFDLMRLAIVLHPFSPFADRVWDLRHNLTAYDAWYVALAESLDCPLVTLDLRLSRASGPTCEMLTPP